MKNYEKSEEDLTCDFKTDISNLTNIDSNIDEYHFNGLLLNKVYNVWAKKVQKSHISWC